MAQKIKIIEVPRAQISAMLFQDIMHQYVQGPSDSIESILQRVGKGTKPERPPEEKCSHLKGGRSKTKSAHKDYAIVTHTFPDNRIEIKCMICGKKWGIKDPEARAMLDNTTNTPSASERLLLTPEQQNDPTLLHYRVKLANGNWLNFSKTFKEAQILGLPLN